MITIVVIVIIRVHVMGFRRRKNEGPLCYKPKAIKGSIFRPQSRSLYMK